MSSAIKNMQFVVILSHRLLHCHVRLLISGQKYLLKLGHSVFYNGRDCERSEERRKPEC